MNEFYIPHLDQALAEQERLFYPSAWAGHIPFASWIVYILQPKILVELGTHNGTSYSAFCQAIKHNNFLARTYAVDTWKGDPHAGEYGEEVYTEYKFYHDVHYKEFSSLMRMTFDEACNKFSDNSIDLLHIDGLHTYAAVKHDFETWLPKISSKGVVLFHDTCVHEDGFGVYQLWNELIKIYPGFNFTHSHGLGVLLVGKDTHSLLKDWSERELKGDLFFHQVFENLGAKYELRHILLDREGVISNQQTIIAEKNFQIQQADKLIKEKNTKISEKDLDIAEKDMILLQKKEKLSQQKAIIAEKEFIITQQKNQLVNYDIASKNKMLGLLCFNLKRAIRTRKIARIIAKSEIFETDWYLNEYHHVALAEMDPILHYINFGAFEGKNPNRFFDTKWYIEQNSDVALAQINPLYHYLVAGSKEGRDPCKFFSTESYLNKYKDVKSSGINPLVHFLHHGQKEGRHPFPEIEPQNDKKQIDLKPEKQNCSVVTRLFKTYFKKNTNKIIAPTYHNWIKRYDTFTKEEDFLFCQRVTELPLLPKISVVIPVFNTKLKFLKEAIQSVKNQAYPHWELCIVDDHSTDQRVINYLKHLLEFENKKGKGKIHVAFHNTTQGIAAATNTAISLASGDYIAFLDHDDVLARNALGEVAIAINKFPEAGYFYSDEDKLDTKGFRCDPFFKPDWNPYLLSSLNYCCHLSVIRRSLLLKIGNLNSVYDGAQDWDLTLRVTEALQPHQIIHISKILYHWRMSPTSTAQSAEAKTELVSAGKLVLERHLQRLGRSVISINKLNASGHWRVQYALPDPAPLVSIIIPTRNRLDLLACCLKSIRKITDYPNYEIIIADNNSDDPCVLDYYTSLENDQKISIIQCHGAFNYSAINNKAVSMAHGEVLVLLNNDIEIIQSQWLKELVSYAIMPQIGAVGALLRYPNQLIQHAGVILGITGSMEKFGVAGHIGKFFSDQQSVAGNRARVVQNFLAVTGACLAVRKQLYEEVGGLDQVDLQVSFNDVDFCLKLHAAGYLNIWTPFAELIHHESASRGAEDTPEKQARFNHEIQIMRQRWGKLLDHDPSYNHNLTLEREDWSLAWPPRDQ